MRARHAAAATLLATAALVAACSHPPRLDIERANRNRDLICRGTPEKDRPLEGELNGEVRKLSKCASRAQAGDTITVKLGPGVYTIDDVITVRGASLVIAGSGADRTRLKLDSDDLQALVVEGSPSFELRGVTVAGYSGGGIRVSKCARVVVNECDFVGSRYGLELADCPVAFVDSCVFAGNEKAIDVAGGYAIVRGTCFGDNWWSITGAGRLDCSACAFFGNEEGAGILCTPESRVTSVIYAQGEDWKGGGRPRWESCLIGPDDLFERFTRVGTETENKQIADLNAFPKVALPAKFDLGGVHYALARFRMRGTPDPEKRIDEELRTEAAYYAEGARRAVAAKNAVAARELARLTHTYLLAMSSAQSRAGFEDVEALAISQ